MKCCVFANNKHFMATFIRILCQLARMVAYFRTFVILSCFFAFAVGASAENLKMYNFDFCFTHAVTVKARIYSSALLYRELFNTEEDYYKKLYGTFGYESINSNGVQALSRQYAENESVVVCPSFWRVRGRSAFEASPCLFGSPRFSKIIRYKPKSNNDAELEVMIKSPTSNIKASLYPSFQRMRYSNLRKEIYTRAVLSNFARYEPFAFDVMPATCDSVIRKTIESHLATTRTDLLDWIQRLR